MACVGFISDNLTPKEFKPFKVPNYFYQNISYSNEQAFGALQELGLNPLQISLRLEK